MTKPTKRVPKVLIGIPICNREWVLPDFLRSLKELDTEGLRVGYYFLENGSTDRTLQMLWDAVIGPDVEKPKWPGAEVCVADFPLPVYDRHTNLAESFQRLALVRDKLRRTALCWGADWLFCVDSDVMLQPESLKLLMKQGSYGKDFVAAMLSNAGGETFEVVNARTLHARDLSSPYGDPMRWELWVPEARGPMAVGGTGACYLMSRACAETCTYLWEAEPGHPLQTEEPDGEDFVFARCCRANGIQQWLDECHRVWHCYTPALLQKYQEARGRHGSKAVKLLTDAAWETTMKRRKNVNA